jgi:hypothetical protein
MGSPKKPKPPKPAPAPATKVDAAFAGEAEKKALSNRNGAKSTWLTKGQSLGGGTNLG